MGKPLSKAIIAKRRSAPAVTDDERAIALVVLDAALLDDPRLKQHDEVQTDAAELCRAARREYLRLFPRCTDIPGKPEQLYVSAMIRTWFPAKHGYHREWDYSCLICRQSLDTLGENSPRTIQSQWWWRLQRHGLICASRLVLGEINPKRPPAGGWQNASQDPRKPRGR